MRNRTCTAQKLVRCDQPASNARSVTLHHAVGHLHQAGNPHQPIGLQLRQPSTPFLRLSVAAARPASRCTGLTVSPDGWTGTACMTPKCGLGVLSRTSIAIRALPVHHTEYRSPSIPVQQIPASAPPGAATAPAGSRHRHPCRHRRCGAGRGGDTPDESEPGVTRSLTRSLPADGAHRVPGAGMSSAGRRTVPLHGLGPVARDACALSVHRGDVELADARSPARRSEGRISAIGISDNAYQTDRMVSGGAASENDRGVLAHSCTVRRPAPPACRCQISK